MLFDKFVGMGMLSVDLHVVVLGVFGSWGVGIVK